MQEIISNFFQFLRANPSLLLFGALAAGYALGKVKFGNFSLGSTTSVLLVAIVLGAMVLGKTQYDLGLIKTVSFGLFIFAIGYKVGPDFIGGLKRGGIKYVVISIFFCVVALIAAIVLSKLFGLNKGYSGGLVAGALTQSSVIGTASGAIQKLGGGSVTSVIDLKSDIAVAYAVTYIFGTAGLIILLKVLVACWKMDLPAYARKAEEELGSLTAPETVEAFHWAKLVVPRAYRVEKKDIAGKTVSEVEAMFSCRVSVSRVKKGDNIITDLSGGTTLDEGDVLVVTGLSSLILKAGDIIGPECDDNVLKQLVGEILGVCLTSKKYDGKTLNEIFSSVGHGCFLRSVTRQGHELPVAPGLKIHRGDIVNVIGVREDIERFAGEIGYAERPTTVTDLVMVSLGIILGTLVGLCSINLGGVPLTLGVGGGVLVSGLFFGWLRSVRPIWGYLPTATQWVFSDLGLNFFIACVGIAAGPRAFEAIRQSGISIFAAGICLTCIPHILTWLFGLYLLKLNPVLLLGAMTGAGTCTAAMNAIKDDSKSTVPVIGYTVPYAIGNVLLTIWGALIVSII